MPIIPVRKLAQYNIVIDVDHYDLPLQAWSERPKCVRYPRLEEEEAWWAPRP